MAYGGLKGVVNRTNRATQGGLDVMNQYYQPSFGRAFQAAERFGQLGQMRGEEDEYRDRMRGNLERFGMAGSGSAMSMDRTVGRQFGAGRFNQGMAANQARFGAFRSLAGQSFSGGMQSLSQRNQAAYELAHAKLEKQARDRAEREQQRAAVGQAVGDVVGIGMSVATGNPMPAFNRLRGRFGGQGGDTSSPQYGGGIGPNPTSLGHYDEYGNWVSDEELGRTPTGYFDENGRWIQG
jgi:hypothetical protein